MDKNNEKKVFNFGDSPLMKQTEKKVTEGYEAIEQKEQGAVEQPQVQTLQQPLDVPQVEPTQNINVPIPVSLHQQLKIYAAQTKQNMKDLVVLAIREYMAAQGG